MGQHRKLAIIGATAALCLIAVFGGMFLVALKEAAPRPLVLCAEGQGTIDPEQTDVIELSDTVCRFLDDWYLEKDEEKFWTYVADDSPVLDDDDAFRGAFTHKLGKVDTSTLKLGVGPIEHNWEGMTGLVVNPGNRRFVILKNAAPEDVDHAEIPQKPSYAIIYFVEGEGYNDEGMGITWVLQKDGWKLWDYQGFD